MSRSPTPHRNHDGPASGVGRSLDDVFAVLASRRRREILAVLRGHDGELSESDLATVLAAECTDKPLLDVTDDEHQRVRTRLRHVHLPKLADADLIRRDESRATVSAGRLGAAAPILDSVRESGADPQAVDAVLSALAVERRRTVLSVLREEGALGPAELAERVAERETGRRETGTQEAEGTEMPEAEETETRETERTEMQGAETGTREVADDEMDDGIEAVRTALRHNHLPKLKEVGLVEVGSDESASDAEGDENKGDADDGNGAISFEGHPALDPRWLRLADEPRVEVSARVRAYDCGAFEGGEDLYVVSSADDLDAGTVVRLRSHTEQGGEEESQ